MNDATTLYRIQRRLEARRQRLRESRALGPVVAKRT